MQVHLTAAAIKLQDKQTQSARVLYTYCIVMRQMSRTRKAINNLSLHKNIIIRKASIQSGIKHL